MKETEIYYIDENNNRWSKSLYTKEQAEKFSKSLVNCTNCDNCKYCKYCKYCYNCPNCYNCTNCTNCYNCDNCTNCDNCKYCYNCTNCDNCKYCYNCTNCDNCKYCYNCTDFKSNPQRITSDKIGSRNSQSTYYLNEEHEQIVCGCFIGTLDEFKEKVKQAHGDNEHGTAYMKWINAVEQYKELIK